ncbi:MAG TPA: 23S rRNA (adenine(1618)-N(6))-methyltransferase RlmF [Spirochaetota bacterium]
MMTKKQNDLHPRNRYQGKYDFKLLTEANPELKEFVAPHAFDPSLGSTIDFSDPRAVKALNKALLKLYYDISAWDIPSGFLCPPIPGRADYIHHLFDLLSSSIGESEACGADITVLDIGTGASCIYPLIGACEYGWSFVASEVDRKSYANAARIVQSNVGLKQLIELRLQKSKKNIFEGVIKPSDRFSLTLCNPPFHSSAEEAMTGNVRKWKNLGKGNKPQLNFGGQSNELWCEGGEKGFIATMIRESIDYKDQVLWFTTLVSKGGTISELQNYIRKTGSSENRVIEMSQGNKISRLLAWTYFSKEEHGLWRERLNQARSNDRS